MFQAVNIFAFSNCIRVGTSSGMDEFQLLVSMGCGTICYIPDFKLNLIYFFCNQKIC
jgi:hypothetical protein